jgi:acetone carboxylase gamma subunit
MRLLDEELADLLNGRLDLDRVREIQRAPKDLDRRERLVAIAQKALGWSEPILLPLQEGLFVVQTAAGKKVRCRCGHYFGDYRRNWKESALIYERDPQDGELYSSTNAPTKDWMVLREFYCPSCATLLDVENVPQGYPFIFNFLPYFDDEPE